MPENQKPVPIFISYVQEDERMFQELVNHLSILTMNKETVLQHHKDIHGGTTENEEIDKQLHRAAIILILMSVNYLTHLKLGNYEQVEVEHALERKKDVHIIPIIIGFCEWPHSSFGSLQPLPDGAKPINSYSDRNAAWVKVVEGIRNVIEDVKHNSTSRTEISDNSLPLDHSQEANRTASQVSDVPINPLESQYKAIPDHQTNEDVPEEAAPGTNRSHPSSSLREQSRTEVVSPSTLSVPPTQPEANPFLTRRNLLIGGGVAASILTIGVATHFISSSSASSSFKSRSSSPTNTNATSSSTTSTNSFPPSSRSSATSWTSFGSNAQNTRYNDQERALRPSKNIRWSCPTGDGIHSSAAVTDSVAYVNSFDGFLYAIKDGKSLWSYDTSQDPETASPESKLNSSSPAVSNGMVYFGSRNGFLYAIDAKTGEKKWRQKTGGLILASPVVVNKTVYIVSFDGNIYAFDAMSGEKKQSPAHVGDDSYIASPAVDGDSIYIASQDTHVYALDLNSFEQNWTSQTLGIITATPAIDGDHVYVCARSRADHTNQTLYALNKKNDKGRIDWRFPMLGSLTSISQERANNITFDSSPAIAYGKVYIGSNDGNLYAIDTKTGKQIWFYKTGGSIYSSPTIADGVVYVGSNDGNIHAVDAQKGQPLWTRAMSKNNSHGNFLLASPTVVQGWLYIGCVNNTFYALSPF